MPLASFIFKVLASVGLMTGPLMVALGLGLIDSLPAELTRADNGKGANKFDWAAARFNSEKPLGPDLSVTTPQVFLFIGICKCLVILDIWVLHVMPRFALLCQALMFAAITWAHTQIPDQLAPPAAIGLFALAAAATWNSASGSGKAKAN